MGGPVFSGASHVTWRLVLEAGVIVGTSGFAGGSFTSVTVIVTPAVELPPLVSVAFTVTEYLDFSS